MATHYSSKWLSYFIYLEKSGGMNNWRLNLRGTWSFTFSDTYIAFTSPWQDPAIGVLLWVSMKQKFDSDFQFELPKKWLLILWVLPLVMWIVDGSVSQVPLIKFVLLARVSRDEPAPNRMIKTYQNILFIIIKWIIGLLKCVSFAGCSGCSGVAVVSILKSLTVNRGRFDVWRPLH